MFKDAREKEEYLQKNKVIYDFIERYFPVYNHRFPERNQIDRTYKT